MDAMALGERYGNPLSVVKIDLDSLASVNEKQGKEAGDRILAGVAAVIADALRMPDKVGRFDEDEFVLVMPQTQIDDAFMIADRLRALVEKQRFDVDGETARITISAGVTEYQPGDDLESLFSRVQKGVDKSRDAGRNRVTRV
jgi:diguanylate cyclase (GGDEF)-like protein